MPVYMMEAQPLRLVKASVDVINPGLFQTLSVWRPYI